MLNQGRKGKLGVERLESRMMLDGNVVAKMVGNDLRITGDSAANEVSVFQLAAPLVANGTTYATGSFMVLAGAGAAGSPATAATTLNGGGGALVGSNARVFAGFVDDLSIDLGGGSDSLFLGNRAGLTAAFGTTAPAGFANFTLPTGTTGGNIITDDLYVQLGDGNDTFGMDSVASGRALNLFGAGGNDAIEIYRSTFKNAFIYTGSGNDTVQVGAGVNAATNPRSLTGAINGLAVTNAMQISTEAGNDTARVSNSNSRWANLLLGSGNDAYAGESINVNRTLLVNGGPGADTQLFAGTITAGKRIVVSIP